MVPVDFHSHTYFSPCGLHTHIEMLTQARALGLQGLAFTDHGPALGGRFCSPFFDRFTDPVPGIRMLKGMECNLGAEPGEIDLPARCVKYMDVVLLGLHDNVPPSDDANLNTRRLLDALRAHPEIDIISHPNDPVFPVHFRTLAAEAARLGVALELNNSKNRLKRATAERTRELIRACREERCRMALNSDAHTVSEIGQDDAVRPLLALESFPEELLINRTAEAAFAFVEERRANKR